MPNAFVVMPFREPYETIYRDILAPTLELHHFKAVRADQVASSTIIADDIQKGIRNADLVVIEASEKSPNVYYEFGLAVANNKELLVIAQKESDLPFDTSSIRHLIYDSRNLETLKQAFGNWLQNTRAFSRAAERIIPTLMNRGEVFRHLADAVLSLDSSYVAFEDRVLEKIRAGAMLPCSYSYYTDSGTNQWLHLCADPEYRVFRDSVRLLRDNSNRIADVLGDDFVQLSPDYVSLGPGDGQKDRIILRRLAGLLKAAGKRSTLFYYPVDVSHLMLETAIRAVSWDDRISPILRVKAIIGDFRNLVAYRPVFAFRPEPNLFCFLGNTLGNIPEEITVLHEITSAMHPGDRLLLEVRLKTSAPRLEGDDEYQFGLSFSPLARLGVAFNPESVQVRDDLVFSQVSGTKSLTVHYRGVRIGDYYFPDVFLSCVNFYERRSLQAALEGSGLDFRVLDVIESEMLVLFIIEKTAI